MSHRVAFYGTLLSVHGAQDHLGIRERCRFVGLCTLRGLLYDLGPYPALVAGDGEVYGEIYEVDEATLRVIDDFEGHVADHPEGSEYVRVMVTTEAGDEVWAYHYRGDLGDAVPIPSGDYRNGNSAW